MMSDDQGPECFSSVMHKLRALLGHVTCATVQTHHGMDTVDSIHILDIRYSLSLEMHTDTGICCAHQLSMCKYDHKTIMMKTICYHCIYIYVCV